VWYLILELMHASFDEKCNFFITTNSSFIWSTFHIVIESSNITMEGLVQ